MIKHIWKLDCYEAIDDDNAMKVCTILAENALDYEVKYKLAKHKYDLVAVNSLIIDTEDEESGDE